MDLVLASTSRTRRALMEQRGLRCRICPSAVDEGAIRADDGPSLALARAGAKARAVGARHPDAVVIGADQVAFDPERPGRVWGKPASATEQLEQLRAGRGQTHALATAVVVRRGAVERSSVDVTLLTMRDDLSDAELAAYVATGEGAGCAGGYAAEGRGAFLFERIDGDWTNVLGLPMPTLFGHLRAFGWRAPEGWT